MGVGGVCVCVGGGGGGEERMGMYLSNAALSPSEWFLQVKMGSDDRVPL